MPGADVGGKWNHQPTAGKARSQREVEMKVDANVIRRAAWTLPAAGLLLGAPWIRPWFADPADLHGQGTRVWAGPIDLGTLAVPSDAATWARIAISDGYQLFSATQALGLLSLVFGLFVLYVYLASGRSPRWATAAVILGVANVVPETMMLGVHAFAEPAVAGLYQNGVAVCPGPWAHGGFGPPLCAWTDQTVGGVREPLATEVALSLVTLQLGSVITWCVAIWRSALLPRWVALVFAVAYVLSIASVPVFTLVGGLLMVVAGGRIALQLNRERAKSTVSHDLVASPTAGA